MPLYPTNIKLAFLNHHQFQGNMDENGWRKRKQTKSFHRKKALPNTKNCCLMLWCGLEVRWRVGVGGYDDSCDTRCCWGGYGHHWDCGGRAGWGGVLTTILSSGWISNHMVGNPTHLGWEKKYKIYPYTQQISNWHFWTTINFRAIWMRMVGEKENRQNPFTEKKLCQKPKFAVWCSGAELPKWAKSNEKMHFRTLCALSYK